LVVSYTARAAIIAAQGRARNKSRAYTNLPLPSQGKQCGKQHCHWTSKIFRQHSYYLISYTIKKEKTKKMTAHINKKTAIIATINDTKREKPCGAAKGQLAQW